MTKTEQRRASSLFVFDIAPTTGIVFCMWPLTTHESLVRLARTRPFLALARHALHRASSRSLVQCSGCTPSISPPTPLSGLRLQSLPPARKASTESTMSASKCPVAHGQLTPGTGGRPSQWWPNSLPLHILHQHPPASAPTPPGFNYAEAFSKLNLAEVKKDIEKVRAHAMS